MADRIQRRRTEAADLQSDVAMWNAVRYLDSSTDYREYIPSSGRPPFFPKSEFVTLDHGQFNWSKLCVAIVVTVFVCTILLLWMRS